jgi:tRNA-dihydrouridine synthase A
VVNETYALPGLNPKQNRDVPPLRYEVVHKLITDFPELTFILNGGIV